MPHPSLRWLTGIGTYLASPYAFAILALYGIVWAFVGDLDFHGFANSRYMDDDSIHTAHRAPRHPGYPRQT